MKIPTIIFIFLLLTFKVGISQVNFPQLLEQEDSTFGNDTISIEDKEQIHLDYTTNAIDKKDTLKQIIGNVLLYADNIKKSNYDLASKYILKSEALSKSYKNQNLLGWIKHKKAVLFVYMRDYEIALSNYQNAASLCLETNDSLCLALSYEQMSSMFGQLKQFDSAQFYFQLAEPLLKTHASDKSYSVSLINYGNLLNYQNRDEEALTYLLQAAEITEQLSNTYQLSQLNHNLAQLYTDLGEYDKALKLFNKCIEVNKTNEWPNRLMFNYHGVSRLYEKMGKHDAALTFYVKYDKLEDSITNAKTFVEIANLESKYELVEKEIQLEQSESKLKSAKLYIQRQIFILILLLLFIISGIYYWRSSNIQAKRKIEENKKNLLKLTQLLATKNGQIAELDLALSQEKNKTEIDTDQTNGEDNIYNTSILTDSDWQEFKGSFEVSYPKFIHKVMRHHNSITEAELRLFMFIKMHLNTKEISSILGISPESVKKTRYRLRKRINLQEQDSLEEIVHGF